MLVAAPTRRWTPRSRPATPRAFRRSRSRQTRGSSCTSWPASKARGEFWKSARSAATVRSGSPARCPKDGRLVTIEANPKYAEVARANIARAGLTARVDLRVGRALETLPQIAAEGGGAFDLTFIDADKQSIPEYFRFARKLSRPGSRDHC